MDHWSHVLWIACGCLFAIALFETIRIVLQRWFRRIKATLLARRAAEGERRAEKLLRRLGYRIIERQPRKTLVLDIDGKPKKFEIRADLLVERKGKLLVAEVKTGKVAPKIETAATRRQLLEYRIAYTEAQGIVLVDMAQEKVQEVRFPLSFEAKRPKILLAFASMAVGIAIGASMMWWFIQTD